MKNFLLGIVIGLCIIAFVKASNPLDSGHVVWLPATYGTVNGQGAFNDENQLSHSLPGRKIESLSELTERIDLGSVKVSYEASEDTYPRTYTRRDLGPLQFGGAAKRSGTA